MARALIRKHFEFVTGGFEEPVLGFSLHLFMEFNEAESRNTWSFVHTCTNCLHLLRGSMSISLPQDDKLFEVYDMAFKTSYFGNN